MDENFSRRVNRYREVAKQAVTNCDAKIKEWEDHKTSYVALRKRLDELPKRISHVTKVPFGKSAFMLGELVHTNEICVLLGDGWFVDRSACQAIEIVDRRLKRIEETLTNLQNEKSDLDMRLQLAEEIKANEDCVEIKEEYDQEKEKEWREKRRHRVSEERQKEASARLKLPEPTLMCDNSATTSEEKLKGEEMGADVRDSAEALSISRIASDVGSGTAEVSLDHQRPHGVSKEDFDALMSRLDELEAMEDEEDGESSSAVEGDSDVDSDDITAEPTTSATDVSVKSEDYGASGKATRRKLKKKVQWSENVDENKEPVAKKAPLDVVPDSVPILSGITSNGADGVPILSNKEDNESDITVQKIVNEDTEYSSALPKSILKNCDKVDEEHRAPSPTEESGPSWMPPRERVILPASKTAFTGTIKERIASEESVSEPAVNPTLPAKPISRFKQRKLEQKKNADLQP